MSRRGAWIMNRSHPAPSRAVLTSRIAHFGGIYVDDDDDDVWKERGGPSACSVN